MEEKILNSIPIVKKDLSNGKIDIDSKEAFLISRIDGRINVYQLLEISGLSEDETIEILFRLKNKGLITFEKLSTKDDKRPSVRHIAKKASEIISDRIKTGEEFFESGKRDLIAMNYKSALTNFKLATAYNPFNLEYKKYQEKAKKLFSSEEIKNLLSSVTDEINRGLYLHSITGLVEGIKNHPNDPDLHHLLSKVYLNFTHDYNEAKETCLKAISLNSDNYDYYVTLGKIYNAMKDSDNAKKSFQKAIKLGAKDAEVKDELKKIM